MIANTNNPKRKRWLIDKFNTYNTLTDPTKIDDSEFVVFENLVLRKSGESNIPVSRNGLAQYNANAIGSSQVLNMLEYLQQNKSSNNNYLVLQTKKTGKFYYTTLSAGRYIANGFTQITNSPSVSNRCDMKVIKDNLYIANVGTTNQFWDGTNLLDVGCPPCYTESITLADSATAGSLVAGQTYGYLICFLYDGYQQGGSIGFKIWTVGALKTAIDISAIPLGNARCTARIIFRTKQSSTDNSIYFLTILNDNTTTTFTDTLADTSLNTPIDVATLMVFKKPYISKYQIDHNNRKFDLNLAENLLNPFNASDITLTSGNVVGGTLTHSTTYYYKFYKSFYVFPNYQFSIALQKSITLGGSDNSVTITYNPSLPDIWVNNWAIQRASNAGGTDWAYVYDGTYAYVYRPITASFTDKLATVTGGLPNIIIPETAIINYPSSIAWSDIDVNGNCNPDLFSTGSFDSFGQDDNLPLNGGFSIDSGIIAFKSRAIYQLYTTSDNPDLWITEKLIDGIGTDIPESIVKFPTNECIFVMQKIVDNVGALNTVPVFYYWTCDRREPVIISDPIQGLIESLNIVLDPTQIRISGTYDSRRKWVIYTFNNAGGNQGDMLIYDMSLETPHWYYFTKNTTNLGLTSPYFATNGDLIFGSNAGYLFSFTNANQDSLGSTPTTVAIKKRIQTKTLDANEGLLEIVQLLAQTYASGTGTLSIYYGVNDSSENVVSPALASGINQTQVKSDILAKHFYLRFENSDNIELRFLSFGADFKAKHLISAT